MNKIKCNNCGSKRLERAALNIESTDAPNRTDYSAYVCLDCRHIEFYASEYSMKKLYEQEDNRYKYHKEKDELLEQVKKLKKQMMPLEKEYNEIKSELERLDEINKDENITIKQHKLNEEKINDVKKKLHLKHLEVSKFESKINEIETKLKKYYSK